MVPPESKDWYRQSVDVLTRAVKLDHDFNDDNRKKELARGRMPDAIPDVGNEQIYGNLGMAYLRLGQLEEAREAFQYGRHISPANPEMLMDLASYFLAKGDSTNAAVYLMEVALVDPRREDAVNQLVEIYRQTDPSGDSLTRIPGEPRPRVNPYSQRVRDHVGAAYVDLVNELRATKHPDLAEQLIRRAVDQDGVSAGLFTTARAGVRMPWEK